MTVQIEELKILAPHESRVEGDTLFVRYRGEVTPEHARKMVELAGRIRSRYGYSFLLTDSRSPSSMPHATRKAFLDATTPEARIDYIVSFGISQTGKTLSRLVARAAKLLGIGDAELEFCDSEEEARAFLEKTRQMLQEKRHARA